eukprot:Sspe_Gene.76349::Locus_47703_Transcript_1_1_Confidence_1.000_Length_2165::g.76349::m.76349
MWCVRLSCGVLYKGGVPSKVGKRGGGNWGGWGSGVNAAVGWVMQLSTSLHARNKLVLLVRHPRERFLGWGDSEVGLEEVHQTICCVGTGYDSPIGESVGCAVMGDGCWYGFSGGAVGHW